MGIWSGVISLILGSGLGLFGLYWFGFDGSFVRWCFLGVCRLVSG